MIDDRCKIYVEQLRHGHVEEVEEVLSPAFLDIHEKELSFQKPVHVKGQVYLAEEMLILHFDIQTEATMPCAICNLFEDISIAIKGFYHAVPLNEIKSAIYDFREIVRESILLEVPLFTECNQGNCPQRKVLQKYFKNESATGNKEEEEGYQPFADLDFDFKDK